MGSSVDADTAADGYDFAVFLQGIVWLGSGDFILIGIKVSRVEQRSVLWCYA